MPPPTDQDPPKEPTPGTPPATDPPVAPPPVVPPTPDPTTDWEARYLGLQSANEKARVKLEKQIADQTATVTRLMEELEAHKTDATSLSTAKTEMETQLTQLNTSLQTLQVDRDALDKKLKQQSLLLGEFPDLAPLLEFIPTADDEAALKANAEKLRGALKSYVDLGVKNVITGATPPVTPTDKEPTETEADKAWATVYATAGVPGKEKEYEEAYAKVMAATQPK